MNTINYRKENEPRNCIHKTRGHDVKSRCTLYSLKETADPPINFSGTQGVHISLPKAVNPNRDTINVCVACGQ